MSKQPPNGHDGWPDYTPRIVAVMIVIGIVALVFAVVGEAQAGECEGARAYNEEWAPPEYLDGATYVEMVDEDGGTWCSVTPGPAWWSYVEAQQPVAEPCEHPDYQDTEGNCVEGPHVVEGVDGSPVPFNALPTGPRGDLDEPPVLWDLVPEGIEDEDPYIASWIAAMGGRPVGNTAAV